MQRTLAAVLFAVVAGGVVIGEEQPARTPAESVSRQSTANPKPPGSSESRRKRMLELIKLLNADDSDEMLSEYFGLMPVFDLQTSPFPRGHRVMKSTIETRISQYEKAYQIQAVFEKLDAIGIDQTLAIRLCREPEMLRSTIKALRTLSSLREPKP